MNKFVIFAVSGLVLSGCQMTGGQTNIADADFDSMTCEQIQQSFADYQTQINDIDTGSSLLSTVGFGADTSEAKSAMIEVEMQAKKLARPALEAKQCSFTI